MISGAGSLPLSPGIPKAGYLTSLMRVVRSILVALKSRLGFISIAHRDERNEITWRVARYQRSGSSRPRKYPPTLFTRIPFPGFNVRRRSSASLCPPVSFSLIKPPNRLSPPRSISVPNRPLIGTYMSIIHFHTIHIPSRFKSTFRQLQFTVAQTECARVSVLALLSNDGGVSSLMKFQLDRPRHSHHHDSPQTRRGGAVQSGPATSHFHHVSVQYEPRILTVTREALSESKADGQHLRDHEPLPNLS